MKTLKDFLISGTPYRGLILQGPFCYCAYVGVPESHWLVDVDSLEFSPHFGITFDGPGDGEHRPEGWHWFGWDCGHHTDALSLPKEILEDLLGSLRDSEGDELELPAFLNNGKRWTIEEVELHIIDAAVELLQAMKDAESHTASVGAALRQTHP